MDLTPFAGINPCGYRGLAVTQLRDLCVTDDLASVADAFSGHIRSLWAGAAGPCLKPRAVAEIETTQLGVA
jgi:lipoyl(octanoyl) transferase